jgi:hypothetical protein
MNSSFWRFRPQPVENLRALTGRGIIGGMTGVHLRKHEAVQDCGSYEVWFDDGRPSKFFYFDDLPNRRLRPDVMTKAQAAEAAQAFARAERKNIDNAD